METKVHVLAQEVQRLTQDCNKENWDVALLENVLEQDRDEAG